MSRLSNTSLIAGFTFLMVISAFAVLYILGTLMEEEIKKKTTEFPSSHIRWSACICENVQTINQKILENQSGSSN